MEMVVLQLYPSDRLWETQALGLKHSFLMEVCCRSVFVVLPSRLEAPLLVIESFPNHLSWQLFQRVVLKAERGCSSSFHYSFGQLILVSWFWRPVFHFAVCCNSLVFLYFAAKIAAVRETGITSKRRNCEKWGGHWLVGIALCTVRRTPEHVEQNMGYQLWSLSTWFALTQRCRGAVIQSSFAGANAAVWKQCLGRNCPAPLNADAPDPELPSGWDLPLVCVINPVRCLMSLALKEPRNEGLFPKQWILFFKETIYISFLLKNQRKIWRFYRSCKIAAPPL